MSATRAPRPIPLSIHAEDLLVAAAIIAALGDAVDDIRFLIGEIDRLEAEGGGGPDDD